MKEATGELNMTVITVVAIAAIAALFVSFVWPLVQRRIVNSTCTAMGANWEAVQCTISNGVATPTGSGSYVNDSCQAAEATEADEDGATTWCCCRTSSNTETSE